MRKRGPFFVMEVESVEQLRILVNSPSVVSEVIEGEAVIMNLASGHYFSCQGVGGEMWSLIEKGSTKAEILNQVHAGYNVEPATLDQNFSAFLASLEEYNLIRQEPAAEASQETAEAPASNGGKGVYREPILAVYSDMEDLLLLDPIHDVDETGWPEPKPAAGDAA